MRVGPVLIHDKGEAPAEWVLGDDIGLTTSVLLAAGLLAVSGAESKCNNNKLMKCGASDEGNTFVWQLSRRPRGLHLQLRFLSLRRQLFFLFLLLARLLSLGFAHFSRTNKNFEAEVSR